MTHRTTTNQFTRMLMFALIGGLVLVATIGALFVMTQPDRARAESLTNIWSLTALATLTIAVWFAAAIVISRKKHWRMPAIGACTLAVPGSALLAALVLFHDQIGYRTEHRIERIGWTLVIASVAIAWTALILLPATRRNLMRIMKICAIGSIVIAAGAILLLIWGEVVLTSSYQSISVFFTIASIGGIALLALLACSIVIPLAAISASNRARTEDSAIDARISVHMTCPRCQHKQNLRTGHSRCESCQIGLFINVEEPRCECGYLLFNLTGDTCPECGRDLAGHAIGTKYNADETESS